MQYSDPQNNSLNPKSRSSTQYDPYLDIDITIDAVWIPVRDSSKSVLLADAKSLIHFFWSTVSRLVDQYGPLIV